MHKGSCLCGTVQYEVRGELGPGYFCHCGRCRKLSGSAFMAGVHLRRSDFRFVAGAQLINRYSAPLLTAAPADSYAFCSCWACVVPDPDDTSEQFEIAAGLLDDDPCLVPDKPILVELKAPWFALTDELPQFDRQALDVYRRGA